MKRKRTLQKVSMAAGVVAMSVGLINSFDVEAQTTGGGEGANDCWHLYERGGDKMRKVCTVLSNGNWEVCKWVSDLSDYDMLSSCGEN